MANTITKSSSSIASEELQLQAKCAQWFWNEFIDERRMLHCNDNNSYNKIEGARKSALGVVRGVSDFELICSNGVVVFIELKIPGGTQSDEQIDFMLKVRERGHIYVIVYSFEEFQYTVYKYLTQCKITGK